MRSDWMIHKNISFSQICFLCDRVLCRYHLSPVINFYEQFGADFLDYYAFRYPDKARLCAHCLMHVQVDFVLWASHVLGT
jgi:hypothetical protein